MSNHKVHVRPVDNKTLSDALIKIDAIMKEFDTKMLDVYAILEEEIDRMADDSESTGIISEIMERIFNDLPDRICFMNELYSIASNASSDDEYEKETIEEESEKDD